MHIRLGFTILFSFNIRKLTTYSLYRMSAIVKSWKEVDVSTIETIPVNYPEEFLDFCKKNELSPPKITTGNGKALAAMLSNPCQYWTRKSCDAFVAKFNIATKDSIQLFNKHSQWGIQTNSGTERGKLYILYPYCLSNKHKMRKNFSFEGTEEEKNREIEKIKSTIRVDYVDVANEQWQLGHKNPGSTDNSRENLVLQPPIQGKYRDNYIFIDTLTKIPLAGKLRTMIEKKEVEITETQMKEYIELFTSLLGPKAPGPGPDPIPVDDDAPGQPPIPVEDGPGTNTASACLDDSVDILADILSKTSIGISREIENNYSRETPPIKSILTPYDYHMESTIEKMTYIADEKYTQIQTPTQEIKGCDEYIPMIYYGPFA